MRIAAAATIGLLTACGSSNEDPCKILHDGVPKGVVLADDAQRCRELLEFSRTVPTRYGLAFPSWLDEVPPQRVTAVWETIHALTETLQWEPTSFSPEPATPPCPPGITVSDELWDRSNWRAVFRQRPAKLYVSLGLQVKRAGDGGSAVITVLQDFDCDGVAEVTELAGEFHRGQPALAGGWRLTRSSFGRIDE